MKKNIEINNQKEEKLIKNQDEVISFSFVARQSNNSKWNN